MEGRQRHWAQPVVTAPAAVRGWRQASTTRRMFALAAAPVVALWTLGLTVPTPLWTTSSGALGLASAVVYAMVGPTVCYALARVLRPHHQPDGDRIIRHPLAAAGTAYGLPVIVAQYLPDDGWESYFMATYGPAGLGDASGLDAFLIASTCLGLGAAAVGVTTLAWGVVALIVRASALLATVVAHRRRLRL